MIHSQHIYDRIDVAFYLTAIDESYLMRVASAVIVLLYHLCTCSVTLYKLRVVLDDCQKIFLPVVFCGCFNNFFTHLFCVPI